LTDQPGATHQKWSGLKIIGAGYGRTGTLSLKNALEELGFRPCYHMTELFGKPGADEQWEAIARGGAVDWNTVFEGYRLR
jgi:Sulfotransferase domain